MKKIALLLLTLSVAVISCQKTVKVPLSYTVQGTTTAALPDVYVPDAGTYDLAAWVKFLTGYSEDSVKLVLKGLPADVVATQDSVKGIPTFIAHFTLNTTHAAHATYPVSIVATAPGTAPQTYNFNLTVVSADCASGLLGSYTGANACTARDYTYTATVASTGSTSTIDISNLGGYGDNTVTHVNLNCNNDSLTIPSQTIGNGTVLQGYGVFTGNKITVYYTASSTPGGFAETCSAVLTKQ